ncbi:MAG TPA: flavin reductase family protein [Verrucomicrobiae bacterium]|nr:flavin reductase family protein [Verrucomicrobiae bacterium]
MSSDGSKARLAPIAGEEFRHVCGRFATGVTIATVLDARSRPHGLTVNSFTSISLTPPLVSISLGLNVTVLEAFREAEFYGINILADNQREISDRFARKGLDRFANISWHRGKSGAPLLAGCLATLECAVRQRILCGDHEIFVGEVMHSQINSGSPLVFYASGYRKLE